MASSFPNPSFGHCSFVAPSNPSSSTHFPLSFPRPSSLAAFPPISSTKNGSVSKIRAKFEKFQGEIPQDDTQEPNPSMSLQQQEQQPSVSQEVEEDDSCLPSDLEGAVRQSGEAAGLFVSSGGLRAIVELLIPQLQFLDDEGAQAELWELSRVFLESVIEETKCEKVKAVFPDAGAAALLEYRWKDASFKISSLSDRKPVDTADEIVVMVVPDYQMLENVEKIAAALSDDPPRPLIMWNPRLISEDVGVGFNVRKLRRYFLSTFTTVYSMRPLPSGAVFRAYPGLWKVFFDDKDRPGRYLLAKELISRPDAGDLEIIFGNVAESNDPSFFDKAAGVLSSVTRFMKAISMLSKEKKIKGEVVLMKSNVLDFNDFNASFLDRLHEFLGQRVSLQLVSAVHGDHSNGSRGILGKTAYLEDWITTITPLTAGEATFNVTFDWDEEEMGIPGAFFITNHHHTEFYLKSLTLRHVPGYGRIYFLCNSWVYPFRTSKKDRVFFVNQTYLPSETPEPLRKLREDELQSLRGDGNGELQEWDRVYDYALYNDLADPDKGSEYARPVLGGSTNYPYPRRGRTGRPPTKSDPETESRIPLVQSLNIYVPRDERFGHVKLSDFLAYALKTVSQFIKPGLEEYFDATPGEFDSFQDVLDLYEGGFRVPDGLFKVIRENIAAPLIKEIFRTDGEGLFKFPMPQVIKEDRSAWRTDEEFGREMLAGVNPVVIRRLQVFPPTSKLDPEVYGDQNSKITEEHIIHNLDGFTVEEAINKNRLFILDHHDSLMPYLRRINTTSTKTYASRTLLFLKEDGTLKPLAIELSLPNPRGDEYGAVSKVFVPAEQGVGRSIWQLAKAYAAVNDSGYHQLISHWLNTHTVIEPFVIATNRQLSVLHPVYKLLHPHFRDTMNINALARQILINAGGLLEATVFPSKYSMEMSAVLYKDWVFLEQALPADLIKRGMAIEDSNSPHGVRLVIEDYPYAVDGLEIWSAIKTWVTDYCSYYYKTDETVRDDSELQSWWKELREKGHGDKKDEPWWPKMQNISELIDTCTIIIWIASALHAAVNFGQYPYAGYLPNRPTISRKFMPEEGTPEYKELESDPDKAFLRTITAQLQTLLGVSLIEILSRHSSDEVYLGQRDSPEWTTDKVPLEVFEKFGKKLAEIEEAITKRNEDLTLKNRAGPVLMPYTLLYPSGDEGLSGRGIPNSTSI
ncbi:probable linoleate 9S-lipoxygenase 5 [Cucurbita pepo subsp. pepo]|uniref:probable linoleate 9S-lipoxygenase 5 n=1 Tax=Cucurbita pepo subsp. pepo TaxID=3664 RepID=UPI000C9D5A65|nr:probable linoleate 9S-lipoxygenase 5 [Cucurbita pepo subsp. pepo]